MSNLINEQALGKGPETYVIVSEAERSQSLLGNIGATATVHLSSEVTFSDIFAGKVPISHESLVYDRSGVQLDTTELLTHIKIDGRG